MPPKNLKILHELKEAGLKTISFDLECPGEKYFNKYCPGKNKSYGYENIRRALIEAIEIFGKGNVFTITIIGIEPADSFVKNMASIINEGVVPTLNVYHYDPLCSIDMDIKEVSAESVINISKKMSKLFKKKGMNAGRLGCAHYDIGHEIRKGYF
jgi:hypothetical protein